MKNKLQQLYNNWRISRLYKSRSGQEAAKEAVTQFNELLKKTRLQPDKTYLEATLVMPMSTDWADAHIYAHFDKEDLDIPDKLQQEASNISGLTPQTLVKICNTDTEPYVTGLGKHLPPHSQFAYGVAIHHDTGRIFVTAGDHVMKPTGKYARLLTEN